MAGGGNASALKTAGNYVAAWKTQGSAEIKLEDMVMDVAEMSQLKPKLDAKLVAQGLDPAALGKPDMLLYDGQGNLVRKEDYPQGPPAYLFPLTITATYSLPQGTAVVNGSGTAGNLKKATGGSLVQTFLSNLGGTHGLGDPESAEQTAKRLKSCFG